MLMINCNVYLTIVNMVCYMVNNHYSSNEKYNTRMLEVNTPYLMFQSSGRIGVNGARVQGLVGVVRKQGHVNVRVKIQNVIVAVKTWRIGRAMLENAVRMVCHF